MKRLSVVMISLVFLAIASCKKTDNSNPTPTTPPTTTPPTAVEKMKDSVLLIAKELYLWYKTIPDTFNPRAYADPNAIMVAIRKYSKEPGFANPVDRYSFGILQTDWNNVSSGISGDFGIGIFFLADGDLRVSYVEKASPAGLAGITRSWRIKSLNGSTNISYTNVNAIVDAVYNSTNTTFGFTRPDGTDTTIALAAAQYQEYPVYLDTVYNVGGKNVGYMVLNSFIGDTTYLASEFDRIFTKFSNANAQEVIVDLRYNGGGYVSLAERMDNYLVPTAGNGDVLLTYAFNDKNTDQNITDHYSKRGSLNLSRVFQQVN